MAGVEINRRLTFVNAASGLATRVINVCILVWMYQYLLERLSPEEFAVYPVVASVIVFAPLFFTIITGGIGRHVTAAYAREDLNEVTAVFSSVFPLLLAAAVLFLVLGAAFSWYVDEILVIAPDMVREARLMMALLVLAFAIEITLLPFRVGLEVHQRFVLLNAIYVAREVLRVALLFGLLVGLGPNVLWVVVATVIPKVGSIVAIAVIARRLLPALRCEVRAFRLAKARRLMSFGAWTSLGMLASMIHTGAGAIVLNRFASALDVTNYHLGMVFSREIAATTAAASAPVQPVLTAMHTKNESQRLANAFLRGCRYALWAVLIVAVPLIVFRHTFVDLYIGPTYQAAATVILLLMITEPLISTNAILIKIAMATGRLQPFFGASIVVQLINLGFMIVMARHFQLGAVGVATASMLTLSVGQVFYFWPLGLRMAGVSYGRFASETLVPALLPMAGGLVVWLGLHTLAPAESWLGLLSHVAAGAFAYVAVLAAFALSPSERSDLAALVNTIRSRGPVSLRATRP